MDPSNTLATPEQYATPQQLSAQRDYAKALLYGSGDKGPQFKNVQSWTQGVSNMVNALMGNGIMRGTGITDANQVIGSKGAQPPAPAVPQPPSEALSSEGQKNTDDDTGKAAKAIASIESKGSGDYAAVGPATRDGDRAYGKYQVMGKNIGPWTKEVLGKEMAPDEFLTNQAAQDQVFKTKFAQGGNNDQDRASVWFTGKPLAQGADRSDGHLNGAQYVQKFNVAMGGPQQGAAPQGSPMAFASSDGGQNPAVQAISSALRGGDQTAENVQVARGAAPVGRGPVVSPQGGQVYYNPALIKPPPQISAGQMNNIMLNSQLTPEIKSQYLNQYQNQQNAIVELPWPGGKVRIDARNPTQQQFIPDLQHATKELPGGLKKPYDYTLTPGSNGAIQTNPAQDAPAIVGPRSEAAPEAPAATPTGAPAGTPAPGSAVAQAAPTAPVKAPAPIQVASLDPKAGFQAAAAAQGAPGAPVAPPGEQVAANAAPPLNPMAQAIRTKPPSSDYSDEDWKSITGYQDLQRQNDIDKEAGIKGVDAAMKKYDTLSTQAQNARKLMPNIDNALALMKDPNFYSGLGANEVQTWNKFKSAFPSLFGEGAQYAAAPNEVFNKNIAGSILDNMRTALGGLGQVRLAEIDLLKQASASNNNTPAANRALLQLSKKALQQMDSLDELGQAYQSGDEVTDPITGKLLLKANLNANGEPQPRRGLDVGYDKLARQFVLDHPTTSPAEAADYKKLFAEDGTAPAAESAKGATTEGAPAVGTSKEFDDGKGGKVMGVWDGKAWGPKK